MKKIIAFLLMVLISINCNGITVSSGGAVTGDGTGDVLGPATHSANYVPQWNGVANSKTLVAGFAISTVGKALVGQSSTANMVTYLGVTSGSGDTISPATNTDAYIPQWDGTNSKTLKNGLANSSFGRYWVNISSTANARTTLAVSRQFSFGIDGGDSTPTTGNLNASYISPITGTITKWYISSDVTGNAVLDIKRDGVSIIGAGNKPTLTATSKNSAAVSSWTSAAITEGDRLTFVLDSVATLKAATVVIKITE